MSNPKPFTHILQKNGILKNFTIAKIFPSGKMDELKEAIRAKVSTEEEFNKVLQKEMERIGNMHDLANPIPGILYDNRPNNGSKILKLVLEQVKKLKAQNFTKNEMSFYMISLINSLNLRPEDFEAVNPKDFGVNPKKPSEDDENLRDWLSGDGPKS